MKTGHIRHNREERTLELFVYENGFSYDIPLQDCADHKALVMWIGHLTSKDWFDVELLRRLLLVWEEATGLPAYGDPAGAKED